MARTSDASTTCSCPVFLIFCPTPSSPLITPHNGPQLWSLQRPHRSMPVAGLWAISLPLALLHFSATWRISLTYAVLVGISFGKLMALFQLTFSKIFLVVVHPKIFPRESNFSFFSFAGCKDEGGCWSVLGPFSRARRSKSKSHFSHQHPPHRGPTHHNPQPPRNLSMNLP